MVCHGFQETVTPQESGVLGDPTTNGRLSDGESVNESLSVLLPSSQPYAIWPWASWSVLNWCAGIVCSDSGVILGSTPRVLIERPRPENGGNSGNPVNEWQAK